MKTETPEEKEALDVIENKQCQCAKVNKTDAEIALRGELDSLLHFLSEDCAWTWNDFEGNKEQIEYLNGRVGKCLDLLEGKK